MTQLYRGHNGQFIVEADVLIITREGFVGRASWIGKDAHRQVPLRNIRGSRLRPATRATGGWLQLVVAGEPAPDLGVMTAPSDANTVMFRHKQAEPFVQLHGWLQQVADANQQAESSSSHQSAAPDATTTEPAKEVPPVSPRGPSIILSDELARLAELYHRGVLDDEEFKAAKRAALGRDN